MGWWRRARWSDVRVAMIMMKEQRDADESVRDDEPLHVGADGSAFGKPPPDHILTLVPFAESTPDA